MKELKTVYVYNSIGCNEVYDVDEWEELEEWDDYMDELPAKFKDVIKGMEVSEDGVMRLKVGEDVEESYLCNLMDELDELEY